jgi:tetratricopeptide (TPR) repeat protein
LIAKEILEKAITTYNLDSADFWFLNGQANLNLGYLIVAESMFTKCLQFPETQVKALKMLGSVYKAQDNVEKAIEFFR